MFSYMFSILFLNTKMNTKMNTCQPHNDFENIGIDALLM
jgi:hypothetical protein